MTSGLRSPGAWLRPAIAFAGGVLWALCFARQPFLVLPWVALAPLVLVLRGRSARSGFGLGWLHGLASWLVGIPWIAPTLVTFGGIPRPLSWVLVALLCAYLAIWQGLFGALAARILASGRTAVVLVGVPAAWVATEWVRGWMFGGFPWNLAAYAAIDVPGALEVSPWIGPYGVSALVVLAATGVALTVARRRLEPAAVALLAVALLLVAGGRWGSDDADAVWGTPEPVRLLQPDIPVSTDFDPVQVDRNLEKVFRMSYAACDEPGTLVVWPESAAWPYSWARDLRFSDDLRRLTATGCPVLFNSAQDVEGRTYNSALLLNPQGAVSRYDKRHLVPWGEYVPLADLLPFVGRLARAAGDFAKGPEARLLTWNDEKIGTAICFEVVFADEVAEMVRKGATILVTITNDAWYGDTAAPWQHLRAARFRAAESRRPLLRAAITGVSAVVDARGHVLSELGVGAEGVLRARVSGRSDLSPYSRRPWTVPAAALVATLLAIMAVRRERRTVASQPAGDAAGAPPAASARG